MEKILLLGDEAIALGAIHAGLSGVYAYPGTPSTEITEFIQNNPTAKERKIHSRWCTNEKTAMEAALGMSYAGKRALVCMTRGFGFRRPLDALLAKRTGFEVLRQICTHSNPRTEQPTGGLRYDESSL